MTNPTDPRFLRREQEHSQVRAITTLLALSQEDAPQVQWRVADDGSELEGHLLLLRRTDVDRRRGLAAWQRVLGAGPVRALPHGQTEQLRIAGSYEGVPVEVVTIVDASPVCCDHCQERRGGEAA